MIKQLLIVAMLSTWSLADQQLTEANNFYEDASYEKALPLYLDAANNHHDPKAAYKLGRMYEEGEGVTQDSAQADAWYKKAAAWKALDHEKAKSLERFYHAYDPIEDAQSSETALELMSGDFALRAYHANYVVASFLDKVPNGDLLFAGDEAYRKAELKFQLSLRGDYVSELFDASQIWTLAYTQRSYWQVLIQSEPFRETNYMPEAFVTFPFYHKLDVVGMKGAALGFIHQSNGQVEYNDENNTIPDPSRSWNRLYTKGFFQWGSFFANLTLWYPILSIDTIKDNGDIVDYYGYGALELNYAYDKLLTRFNGRYNASTHKGAAELELTYPVGNSKNVFYYVQGFSGYGQSLIDFRTYINQVGFGISASR